MLLTHTQGSTAVPEAAIADISETGQANAITDIVVDDDQCWQLPRDLSVWEPQLAEALPLGGLEEVRLECMCLPPGFVQDVVSFVVEQDSQSHGAFPVSALEMVFVLLRRDGFLFPAVDRTSGKWADAATLPFRPHAVTVAVQFRLVKQVLRGLAKTCKRDDLLVTGFDLVSLGVCFPLFGMIFGCDASILFQARQDLFSFTSRRPLRVAADLARPFRG